MYRLFRWFGGFVELSLWGRQVNRFLNLCSGNGIGIWNVMQDASRYVRIRIRLRDFYDLKPFLRKTKTGFRIMRKLGYPFWCHRHPFLKWLPVLCMSLVCLFLYVSTFLWQIEIKGNTLLTEQEVLTVLEAEGIKPGQSLKTIDCNLLEYTLRHNFHNLGWVSVSLKDNVLCIDIRESLYDVHEFTQEDGKRYDLIAAKDAYIHSMVTRSGTAVAVQNSFVRKGDVLVEGICNIYDDSGSVSRIMNLKADAAIIGEVEYNYTGFISEMEILSMKIANMYDESTLLQLGRRKTDEFLNHLEQNAVKVIGTSITVQQKEHKIYIYGQIKAREEIGINIPVEELREYELERENNSNSE